MAAHDPRHHRSFHLLPEGTPVTAIVDDPDFTEITDNGEIYTMYRIVRFTHEALLHPDGWTHLANVVRLDVPVLGVALLQIADRTILQERVFLTHVEP